MLILDELTDSPLPNANIQLQDPENKKLLYFGVSDKNGQKTFVNLGKDSLLLVVSYLGYLREEQLILLSGISDLTIKLKRSEEKLDEVLLTGYPPSIIAKKDSISYNLKSFIDGTERNLGEALNKLPGINVDADGIVSFEGKKIDRVLVEGNDFFDKKHQMATQNFRAEMVEKAEILRNYSDNSLDERSDRKTVLNLNLYDKYKNRFTGNTNAEYGFREKYMTHGNFFRFDKNSNLAIIADVNNIGHTPITLKDYIEMRGGIEEFAEIKGNFQTVKVDSRDFPRFLLDRQNIKKKENDFLALTYNKKKEKFKVNLYSLLNYSRHKTSAFRSITYLNNMRFDYTEVSSSRNNSLISSNYLNINYRPKKNNFWRLQLNYNPNQDKSEGNQVMNIDASSNSYFTERKNNNNSNIGYELSYQTKVREDLILVSKLLQKFSNSKNNLYIESNSPILFLEKGVPLNQWQSSKELSTKWDAYLNYYAKNDYYKLSSSFQEIQEKMNTMISDTEYHNSMRLKTRIYRLSLTSRNNLAKYWTINIENNLFLYQNDFENTITKTRYEPLFRLIYSLTNSSSLNLQGEINNSSIWLTNLLQNPIVLNYRSLSKSSIKENDKLTNHRELSLTYSNLAPQKEYFTNIKIGYAHSEDEVIYTNLFSDNIQTNTYVFSAFTDKYYLQLRLDRKFQKIPFSIKNVLFLNYSKSMNFPNDIKSILTNMHHIYKFNLFSHFKKNIFQFEIGSDYSYNSFKQDYNNIRSNLTRLDSYIKFKGVLQQRIIWELRLSSLNEKSPLGKNDLFYVNPFVSIDSKNKKWTYSISGQNIFNLKDNKSLQSSYSSISINNSEIAVLDGNILAGVKYNF